MLSTVGPPHRHVRRGGSRGPLAIYLATFGRGSRVVLSRMLCRFLPCAYQCICVHYSALGVHFASAPPKYHASTRLFVAFLCVAYPCMLILCCIFIEFPWAAFLCISLVAFVSMRCYFVLRRIRQHSHPVYTTCIWTHMHCIS